MKIRGKASRSRAKRLPHSCTVHGRQQNLWFSEDMVAHNLITNFGGDLRVGQQHRMGYQWHASALCQVKAGFIKHQILDDPVGAPVDQTFHPFFLRLQDGQGAHKTTLASMRLPSTIHFSGYLSMSSCLKGKPASHDALMGPLFPSPFASNLCTGKSCLMLWKQMVFRPATARCVKGSALQV